MRWRRPSLPAVVTAVVVGGITLFTLAQLAPSLLVARTTTAGGDMGAHVWGPAYLRDHLLQHGRISGWSPDWYAGFPWLQFYFPLPSLLIVALDVVLPYTIAFKLVTVLGVLSLPTAAWAFGRLSAMRAPGPACLAVATLPFLFERSFTIYGGNIPSTLAGEFAFSISLSLGMLFLGVVARGLETGRHRALAASLLLLTAVAHVVPTFFVLAGAAVLLLMRLDRHRLRWMASTGLVGALLVSFWVVPFVTRIAYTNDMGWEKLTTYRALLLPHDLRWLVAMAAGGALAGVALRRRTSTFLTVMTALSGLAFVAAPQSRLWNARLLPFWFLCLYLLAGAFLSEVVRLLAYLASGRERIERSPMLLAGPIAVAVAAVVLVGTPLHVLPSWMAPHTSDDSFIPSWVRWNYSGYERKAAYPEYRDLVSTMAELGRRTGCGRAMWEYEPELNRLGTPMALMLLPYWTDGCIGSMEGLFFESSATTPYHFLNQSELSKVPSRAQRDLPYRDLSVAEGVEHLQLLGVRYYMAISPEAQAQADAEPGLRLLTTSGPWAVDYKDGAQNRTWKVYEVDGADLVAPLTNEPVVLGGLRGGAKPWLDVAVPWYQDRSRWDVEIAARGPSSWRRIRDGDAAPPRRALPPVTVSRIRTHDDRISFDVDRIGVPVLVKVSYFPNWHASGGRGPWRVAPNLMVVVPTSRHVSLHYGWTGADTASWALTLLGLVGLVLLARSRPVRYPVRTPAVAPIVDDDDEKDDGEADGDRELIAVARSEDSTA